MRKFSLIAFAFSAVVSSTSMLYSQSATQPIFLWQNPSGAQPLLLPDLFPSRIDIASTRAASATRLDATASTAKPPMDLAWKTRSGVQPVVIPDLFPGRLATSAPAPVETQERRLARTNVATQTLRAETPDAEMLSKQTEPDSAKSKTKSFSILFWRR